MNGTTPQQQIINACEAQYQQHIGDCSGFAKAVAATLGITLEGMANDIVDQIQAAPWTFSPMASPPKIKPIPARLLSAALRIIPTATSSSWCRDRSTPYIKNIPRPTGAAWPADPARTRP